MKADPHAPSGRCPVCGAGLAGAGWCGRCVLGELAAENAAGGETGILFSVPGHAVLAELGRGAAGIVYRARQERPARDVALKILRPHEAGSAESRARFRLEATTVAGLDHPAILPVLSVGEHDGLPYFTMKLCAGGSLAQRIGRYRGNGRESAALVAALADAVHHAHQRGVLHRDLKPGNILFDEADRAFVSDFGIAKSAREPGDYTPVTQPLSVMGTRGYLAPEVLRAGAGAATSAADVYGLGAILHELLTGAVPAENANVGAAAATLKSVPRDLAVIAGKCLQPEPAGRYASAAALAEDLRAWLAGRPIAARPVSAAMHLVAWSRRNPAPAALSLVLLLALAGGGAVLARSNRQLRAALQQAEGAETTAQDRLHGALLDQARLVRTSGRPGQRYDALEVLARAAAIRPSIEVRNETAAALARVDLRFERRVGAAFLDEVSTLAFARDFQSYLSYSGAADFVLLSTADGKVVRRFRPLGEPGARHFAWSGNGRWLAAEYIDGRVELWSRTGETPAWTLPPQAGPTTPAYALHPEEPVCAWADEAGAVQLRRLDRAEVRPLAARGAVVARLAYSPDGRRLAVAHGEQLAVIDGTSGETIWKRDGRWGAAVDLAWSIDGLRLAAVERTRGEVAIFDAASGRAVQTLPATGGMPRLIAFHPDGRRLAVLASDAVLRIWDALSGEVLLQTPSFPRVLAFSPDGKKLATAVRTLEVGIFSWADSAVFRELAGDVITNENCDSLAVGAAGRLVATSDLKGVRLWSGERGAQIGAFDFPPDVDGTSVHLDPAGSSLIYSVMKLGVFRRKFAIERDARTGRDLVVWGEPEPVGANRDGRVLGFRRDGRDWYVDREKIARVVVWPDGDAGRERALAEVKNLTRPAVGPDGQTVITMGYPLADVRVTRATVAEPAVKLPVGGHANAGFSNDGRWLVTATDAEYQVWSLPGLGAHTQWACRAHSRIAGAVAFSPDSEWIAVDRSNDGLELRDTGKFRETVALIPPGRIAAERIAWSGDGTRLYILGHGHRLFEWDLVALRRELGARGLEWPEPNGW